MNLADMLCYADIDQLEKIARSYGCECDEHSKHALIQSILTAIGRRPCIEAFVSEMNEEDIRFFNSLLYESNKGYSLEELTMRARQARFAAPGQDVERSRELIVRYKQRGWLFNGHSQQTRFLFHTPKDLFQRVGDALEQRFRQQLVVTDEPAAYRDEQDVLARDVLCLLQFISRNDVSLTSEGAIYKRTLISILDCFAVKEQPLGRVGFRFGYGRRYRDYPDRFSYIYDYCYYKDYICEADGGLWLTESGRAQVAARRRDDLKQLFRLWIRLYKGPIPNVLAIANWIVRLTDEWVTIASLTACMQAYIQPYYYDKAETIVERRIIQMLMHLGLVRIGEHAEHGLVVRANARALALAQGTFVTDDETIKLPAEASLK